MLVSVNAMLQCHCHSSCWLLGLGSGSCWVFSAECDINHGPWPQEVNSVPTEYSMQMATKFNFHTVSLQKGLITCFLTAGKVTGLALK